MSHFVGERDTNVFADLRSAAVCDVLILKLLYFVTPEICFV